MSVTKISNATAGSPAIGIGKEERKEVAKCLSHTLAETYRLQLKTQYYHWNVTGPNFQGLHALFNAQYEALSAAVDELAERIRALGHITPGTFREFTALASGVEEDKSLPSDWQTMVSNLAHANEAVVRSLRSWLAAAQKAGDEGTADLFIKRLQEHEKAAWMLRSHLQ